MTKISRPCEKTRIAAEGEHLRSAALGETDEPVTARKIPSSAIASWGVVAVVTRVAGRDRHFRRLSHRQRDQNATQVARPHEVQTALEHSKSTLDALQDSCRTT